MTKGKTIKIEATTYIRIKRAKPIENLGIRLFHKIRRTLGIRPLWVLPDETPQALFWLLYGGGVFHYEESIIANINRYIIAGYSVRVEQPLLQKENEYEIAHQCSDEMTPIFQIQLKLSLQDIEAKLHTRLIFYPQAQNAFLWNFSPALFFDYCPSCFLIDKKNAKIAKINDIFIN